LNINLQKLQLLIPWDLGDYDIQKSKFFFWGVFFSVNFFIPKLMKIRWSSPFFGTFAHHFQIKLSIHGSNCNSRFVSMSELGLFLLMGDLDSKLQHFGPCKNSWKKSKTFYDSSHKLPKQQLTSFCSQGILEVKQFQPHGYK
jgi:hypothetical protein